MERSHHSLPAFRWVALAAFFGSPIVNADVEFTAARIPTHPDGQFHAAGLSDNGMVVGAIYQGQIARFAAHWSVGSSIQTLEDLGGGRGAAVAANPDGWIAGAAIAPNDRNHAVKWSPAGTIEELHVELFTNGRSGALGVNAGGSVIGTTYERSGAEHAFYWTPDETHLIGGPEYRSSFPYDLNDHGVVVGTLRLADPDLQQFIPFAWDAENGLRTLNRGNNGVSGHALAVNNAGHIAGTFMNDPCIWLPDGSRVLLGGNWWPTDMNGADLVVGTDYAGGYGDRRAMIWSSEAGTRDLSSLVDLPAGVWLTGAHAVNERGQVLASAYDEAGQERSYLLTPVPTPGAAIVLALAVGAAERKFRMR